MLFAKAGYAIAISNSRGQEFLTPLVNLIGVKTTTVADAIKFGDVILLVLPWRKRQELFTSRGYTTHLRHKDSQKNIKIDWVDF